MARAGTCHPFLETLGYTANFAIPMLGPWWTGTNSIMLIYCYLGVFDFLNAWGHCNFEIVPYWCALCSTLVPTLTALPLM
jgi:ABC-type polysaccharide/polyol phosphate export permease